MINFIRKTLVVCYTDQLRGAILEEYLINNTKKLVRGPVTMSVDIDDCKIGTFAYGVTGSKYKGKIGWITNVGNITKRVTIQYSDNRKQAWALRNIRFAYAEEINETIKTSAPYLDFVREKQSRCGQRLTAGSARTAASATTAA